MDKSWVHPTGGKPEQVIMLLLGETKREYADMQGLNHNRVFPAEAEVWTVNAGFRIWPHDLVFVMDDLALEGFKWPGYAEDLAAHDRPILTSHVYHGFPLAHEYPFRWVCEALRLVKLDRYFYNSVPYMIAYALAIGVKKLTLFGADYHHPNTPGREADLANAEWWLGFARGRGVQIQLPHDTTLMRAREHGRPLYGYRFDPRVSMDRAIAAEKAQGETKQLGDLKRLNEEATRIGEKLLHKGSVAYDVAPPTADVELSPGAAAFPWPTFSDRNVAPPTADVELSPGAAALVTEANNRKRPSTGAGEPFRTAMRDFCEQHPPGVTGRQLRPPKDGKTPPVSV